MSKGGYEKLLRELQAANALIANLRQQLAELEARIGSGPHARKAAAAPGALQTFKWQDALTVFGAAIGLAAMNDVPILLRLVLFGVCAICMSISFLGHTGWPRTLRWLFSIGICALMAVTGRFTWKAWEENTAKGSVAVYFSESSRFPAQTIDLTHGLAPVEANMESVFAKAPVHQLRLRPGAGRIVMSVIVRNTSNVAIKNAHITIFSTTPIVGKTMGGYTFSDRNLIYEDRVLKPFSRLGEEYFISVEFQDESTIPHAIIGVSVDADNMDPYLGAGVFALLRADASGSAGPPF